MPHTDRSGITTPGKIRNAKPGTRSGPVRIATHHPPHTPTAETRHTLAVSTLLDAHRQGRDVDACIAVLSTHLGHISPAHTYWYLTITPALADAVSERAALYYQGGNFR